VSRKITGQRAAGLSIAIFAGAYAAIWAGFSVIAVIIQLFMSSSTELSMMMAVSSATLGGLLLVAAGLYQMSPLKHACLRQCQMPLMYLARSWKSGPAGALRMGVSHGLHCIGCCWALMGLLFYGGVMELRWIVGLALYVAVEKLVPVGSRLSNFTGVALIGWGLWTLVYR
jgi:predicted metal-binding membrane protein